MSLHHELLPRALFGDNEQIIALNLAEILSPFSDVFHLNWLKNCVRFSLSACV
jgi:hypothetical protein